jgi:hypothetical protein
MPSSLSKSHGLLVCAALLAPALLSSSSARAEKSGGIELPQGAKSFADLSCSEGQGRLLPRDGV